MVELDQFRYRISGYDKPMAQIKNSLDLDNKQKRIEELEADMESPGFWDNPDKSQNAMKELKGLKDAFERYNELETGLDDVKTLIEMAEESNDQSLIPEIEEEIMGLEDKMESLRIETLLSGEHDACDAILTLHAGAGGTESCDWCQMLFRMYTRWAESHGYTTETLDYLEGEEAGIKSVTIEISGDQIIYTNAIMMWKNNAVQCGGWDETFMRHQEAAFLLRYFYSGNRIGTVPECLVEFDTSDRSNVANPVMNEKYMDHYLITYNKCIKKCENEKRGSEKRIYTHRYRGVTLNYLKAKQYKNAMRVYWKWMKRYPIAMPISFISYFYERIMK